MNWLLIILVLLAFWLGVGLLGSVIGIGLNLLWIAVFGLFALWMWQ